MRSVKDEERLKGTTPVIQRNQEINLKNQLTLSTRLSLRHASEPQSSDFGCHY